MREPLQDQLECLLAINLPSLETINLDQGGPGTAAQVEQMAKDVEQILFYLETAQAVLAGLEVGDDAEWMYEGRQAVVRVGSTIMSAGDVIERLTNVLEQAKRQERGVVDTISEKVYLFIAKKLEVAMRKGHEIVKLVTELRKQVDVATEWVELHNQILNEVQDEIQSCLEILFEVQEKRHFSIDSQHINLDAIKVAMDEAPFLDRPKLPNLSQEEKSINTSFIELTTRIKPLHASLKFLPIRIEQYVNRAATLFPSSIQTLKFKYNKLQKLFQKLQRDTEHLEKEMGEDRWTDIFRSIGKQATEMLDSWQCNLDVLAREKPNVPVDMAVIERLITKNAYLMPAINRIIGLIDRAVKDRYTVYGELITLRSKLHQRWDELLTRAGNEQIDIPESPTSRYAEETASVTTSNRTSTTLDDSSLTPASSPESPAVGHLPIGKRRPIPFTLKSRSKKDSVATVSSVEESEEENNAMLAENLSNIPNLVNERKSRRSLLPVPSARLSQAADLGRILKRHYENVQPDLKPAALSHIPILSPVRRPSTTGSSRQSIAPDFRVGDLRLMASDVATPPRTPRNYALSTKRVPSTRQTATPLHQSQHQNQYQRPHIYNPHRYPRSVSRIENSSSMINVPKLSSIQPTPLKTTTAVRAVSVSTSMLKDSSSHVPVANHQLLERLSSVSTKLDWR